MSCRMECRMKLCLLSLILSFLCHETLANCLPNDADLSAELHWSDSAVIMAPNCFASIEVRADPQGDLGAKVYLLRADKADVQMPFDVFRDGTLYWDHSGNRLAFQDAYSFGVYRLWLFDIESDATMRPHSILSDEALRKSVESRLNPGESIARYWPDIGRWLSASALVTVRIQTLSGDSGPLTERCFGFLVSTVREDQISEVADSDLQEMYKANCRRNEK